MSGEFIVSSFLYGLGRAAFRRRRAVLAAWLLSFVVLGGLAGLVSDKFAESFSLPGTESQEALDGLRRVFPQVSGTRASIVFVAPDGSTVNQPKEKAAIEKAVKSYQDMDRVDSAISPFDTLIKGSVSADKQAAIIQLTLKDGSNEIPDAVYAGLEQRAADLQASVPGSTASAGGEAYGPGVPALSLVEGIGVLVAMVVLFLTLGSLRAAGMPLITALLGVAITMVLIFGATGLMTVSSTTPMLALMLGLAVGIDYALFILSRHRDQLGAGMDAEESVAQSIATAGSAVVFAGLTVMIALSGLAVARIPFLTTMGIAAAIGVAVAVAIALTLLPAMLGFAGDKLRPKPKKIKADKIDSDKINKPARIGLARRWVRLVTKIPLLTIVLVVVGLGAMAYPATDLRIALPSNAVAAPGSTQRTTYDLLSDHFGAGFNGPLVVTATIVGSDDPLQLMEDMADDIRALPGVADVPLSTPNQDASAGIIQVVPKEGPDSGATKALVRELRGMQPYFLKTYDVEAKVTGYTAVAIDISDRLGRALIPFGILVVGLSLVLLTMVFRSVAVPIKATIGYLLSVGASFGATAMVFEWGWFSGPLNVHQTAPVISFLPILLMGILFGLAMDYEVFLVSRMREHFVHDGDARQAVEDGFAASSRVVVAAAVIMFAVFAAFVPHGDGPMKTIAFGLAVGVFVDAFIVRMTLVPAVLHLLGRSAWWLPRWIDQRLPTFDVEGEGLAHQVSLANWPAPNDPHLIYGQGLQIAGIDQAVDLALAPREVLVVEGLPNQGKTSLLLTLAGRMRFVPVGDAGRPEGRLKIARMTLPEQAPSVRGRTAYVDAAQHLAEEGVTLRNELQPIMKRAPQLIMIDHADALIEADDRVALASLLDELVNSDRDAAVVLAVRDSAVITDLLPGPYRTLALGPSPTPAAAAPQRSFSTSAREV